MPQKRARRAKSAGVVAQEEIPPTPPLSPCSSAAVCENDNPEKQHASGDWQVPSAGLLRRDRAGERHCWLNAAVMALFASTRLRSCILSSECAPASAVMVHLRTLFGRLNKRNHAKPIDPADLLRVVEHQWLGISAAASSQKASTSPVRQQDPSEFLTRYVCSACAPPDCLQLLDGASRLSCTFVFTRAATASVVQCVWAQLCAAGARHRPGRTALVLVAATPRSVAERHGVRQRRRLHICVSTTGRGASVC